MILKSLELVGFKSFVEQTRLDFTQGFTAIVGPNGCGKSNISDAIRWVIGEQNSRTLRGTKLTDLIFNGSDSRKPVNRAEISLTIGNVPPGLRIANVLNTAEEIKITRCCYRSGESEYYINQIPCRLKDIVDLFLDVGISPRSMTIIEQNQIQQIITCKPEERRQLIEEAAGILKFKHRKHEAQLKLDAAGQNLLRIGDLVRELGRQAESLKRQAAKTERYKRFKSDIKELSLNLSAKKIRLFQKDLEKIEEDYRGAHEQKVLSSARVSSLENQIENLKIEIDKAQSAANLKRENIHELTDQISKAEHNIELRQTQTDMAQQDSAKANQEISKMKAEIDTLTGEMENQRGELGQVSREIDFQEENCDSLLLSLNQEKDHLREKEEEGRSAEKKVMDLYHHMSLKKNELTALYTRKQFLQSREEKLQQEQTETHGKLEEVRGFAAKTEGEFNDKSRQFESLKARQQEFLQKIEACKARLNDQSERLVSVKDTHLARHSLLNSIKELRSKFEGFRDGVKSLMSYNANGGRLKGLREVLVDVLQTPTEYEQAVEAVLGEKLQSVIVNSYEDSIEAIDFLKSRRSGRSSFIPIQPKSIPHPSLNLNGNPAVLGKIMDLIRCREEYRPIMEQLLGNVVLVKDLQTALNLHTQPDFQGVVVTQNGEVIDSHGMISGGDDSQNSSGLLAQKREINELSGQVATLKQELDSTQSRYDELTEELAGLEKDLDEVRPLIQETEIARAHCRKDLEQFQKEIERLEQKQSTLNYENSTGSIELQELTDGETTLEREIASTEQEKTVEEKRVAELRQAMEQFKERLESKSADINTIKVLITSLQGKRDILLSEIKRLDLQQETFHQRITQRQKDIETNSAKIAEHQQASEGLEKQILEDAHTKDRLSGELVDEEDELRKNEETLEQKEQESKSAYKQVQELTETLSGIDLKRSEIKIQTAHLQEQAFSDFNVTLEEMLSDYTGEVEEAAAEEELRVLRDKVGKMGEVNLAALSEFQQMHERYTFLKRQMEDLEESIKTLHTAIEKINRTTRQRFEETFHLVNGHFQTIYARLFRGGKAQLILCDESNPLESGIDITAQPMGKKMQHLSLLSGGEKAMTSIALVFALLKVRPSPFCLLDEVDAPLDEPNVIRFQEMLQELSGNTQFILITHNQKTISFADILYGVTMEEDGVSKVVSVHLN